MLFCQINWIHGILIRHPRVSYESMAEYIIEKCSILTYFGNKKNLENKIKMRPRAPLDFQKRMIN